MNVFANMSLPHWFPLDPLDPLTLPSCLCFRLASVVSWLESMADDGFAGGPGAAPLSQGGFADHDGVWIETRQQAGSGGGLGLEP